MKTRLIFAAMAAAMLTTACSDDDPIIPYEAFGPSRPYTLNVDIDGMTIDSALFAAASATCSEKPQIDFGANDDGSLSVELPVPNNNIKPEITMKGDTIIGRRQYSVRIDVGKKRATFKVGMESIGIKGLYCCTWWKLSSISMNGKDLGFDQDHDTHTCYVKLKLANGKIVPAEQQRAYFANNERRRSSANRDDVKG